MALVVSLTFPALSLVELETKYAALGESLSATPTIKADQAEFTSCSSTIIISSVPTR